MVAENLSDDIEQKGLVLLDLDNTCICAINKNDKIPHPEHFRDGKIFSDYIIYERPYLQPFLKKLFKKYRVAVWTAAGISYANFIIDNFILTEPDRHLEFTMWNEHCEYSEDEYGHQKKLKILMESIGERIPMVILDDNMGVLKTQSKNSVNSRKFDVMSKKAKNDLFLLENAMDEIDYKIKELKRSIRKHRR